MRIAPEGWPFIRVALALDAALAVVWYSWPGWTWLLLAVGIVLTAWVAAFFRDPERTGPRGEGVVIAPADGRVCSIAQVDEPMYLHHQATRISIFMSVFDVHVNRLPVSGEVEVVHYNPGEFTVASHDKASLVNEQSSVGIQTPRGQVLVRQIAGSIARRIVTDVGPGDRAEQGARFGMIRFGSRVDVFLEPSAAVKVELNQTVRAGETVLAELRA
ncbi:MAG TPA: phosphatidylserine decarboxylase family protein [Gemmatimonadales bacterium]|nr:phosphatidylserine decarboxylase family protein [Gemmatimonadales bacterium]